MKTRTTLVLLAIAVAAALYIKFYESKRPSTGEAQQRAQNIVNIDRDKIEGITIQHGDDTTELRRQDKKWRIEAPIKDQADNAVIEGILFALEGWQKESTIPEKELDGDKARLEEYGLIKPKLRLKLSGSDAPPEILFGKDAAFEGKMYVRLGNSKETYIAPQTVKNEIAKKPEEFRDKKLTDAATADITRVLLKTAAGELELQKKADQWEIVKPLRSRADNQKIGDLIAQVTTARIEKFVADDKGDLKSFGLAEPRGSITLFAPDDTQGKTLHLGGAPEQEKDKVYVRFVPRAAVYTLPKKIEELLNTKPDDLRDRHLVRFDPNILDRITIESPGKAKTVLARKEQKWTIASRNDQPANAAEVAQLLDTLKNEQVTQFVENVASDLPKYGLDKPQLQVTLSSFASENTAETKAGENPFATLAFGRIEGENVFARLGEEPFIFAARRSLLDRISADPVRWQELAIFRLKPEQIHRLTVITDKERALVRGSNNEWAWVQGSEPLNQVNVQSLLNTLTNLSAVRWAGATTPAHGLEKPQLSITFTSSPDDKKVHKISVGGPASDGMWYARVDEREGTFVINNPDLSALRLPLVGTPPPLPAASPTGAPQASAPTGTP